MFNGFVLLCVVAYINVRSGAMGFYVCRLYAIICVYGCNTVHWYISVVDRFVVHFSIPFAAATSSSSIFTFTSSIFLLQLPMRFYFFSFCLLLIYCTCLCVRASEQEKDRQMCNVSPFCFVSFELHPDLVSSEQFSQLVHSQTNHLVVFFCL